VRALVPVLVWLALASACSADLAEGEGRASPQVVGGGERAGVEVEAEPAAKLERPAEAAPEPEPTPEPEPAPFAGRQTVRVDELLAALSEELEAVAASEQVRADFEAFLETFELDELTGRDELYLDYVRVKIAFEATRAGGWWGLAWDITNKKPRSDEVWARWHGLELGPAPAKVDELAALPATTAVAECDELSALFAFVARRLGLSKRSEVGLFWPTGNHTVAVWTIDRKTDDATRVVVPTSQVFLDGDQSLGTREFDPWTQKNIFDYRRQDAAASLELPGALASAFVVAVRERGGLSQAELQRQRNARESRQWTKAPEQPQAEPGSTSSAAGPATR
jgi:hypothetical protein